MLSKHLCFDHSSYEENYGIRYLVCFLYTTNEYVHSYLGNVHEAKQF